MSAHVRAGQAAPVTDDLLREITQKIVAAFAPEAVILVGSRVYGQPEPDSDIDLQARFSMRGEVAGWLQKAEADFQTPALCCASAVAALDQFGTDIRYPGVSATPQGAHQAFEALKQLRAFVRAKMGLA